MHSGIHLEAFPMEVKIKRGFEVSLDEVWDFWQFQSGIKTFEVS